MTTKNTNLEIIRQELTDDSYNSDLWDYAVNTEQLLTKTADCEVEIGQLMAYATEINQDDCEPSDFCVGETIEAEIKAIENDTYAMPSDFANWLVDNADWKVHATDNTYNNENDLSNDFCWALVSKDEEPDWCWNREPVYLIVAILTGGDPRGCGNYASCRVFQFDNVLAASGILEWTMGWHLESVDSDDEIGCEQYSPGYHSSPTSALDDALNGTFYDSENDTLYGLLGDDIAILTPYHYYSEVERIR